ncbi:hypothetical protein A4A49_32699 [Nicotiana attenuata]|uniref:Receptor-like protein kinase n=3 Tax=Nicotiana attenuata TaxID=49451 RepID=A0A1J6JHS8_NICAT|nr:hypothetical protein A4A49_61565 [Nicotiana attenuata]OIT29757.1 hypothetical protein A4A49_32699 [Nicotiana attenuata]
MFGVLLVELFAKIKKIPTPHYCWIQEQLQGGKKSIVDKSLLQDNDDDDELLANSITTIAAKCLERDPDARTGMKNVSVELSNLLDGARRERGTKRKAGS